MSENQVGQSRVEQVAQVVRERIASGEYAPEGRVPGESDLMEEFGVTRVVANKAMRALRAEGLIHTVKGMGSFVSKPDGG